MNLKLLKDISYIELSKEEFTKYVNEYFINKEEYDMNSEYLDVIYFSKKNINMAYEFYKTLF